MENPQRLDTPRLPTKAEALGIIVGMLLGDACITRKYQNKLILSQGEKQKEYLDWKVDLLKSLGFHPMSMRTLHPYHGKYKAYIIDIKDEKFRWFYRKFYGKGRKSVTPQMLRHLNSYGLAMWYMDDGDKVRPEYDSCRLNTQCFTDEEQQLMVRWFKKKHNLDVRIHKDKTYKKLYFTAKDDSARRFLDLVSPYIHQSMVYKLR